MPFKSLRQLPESVRDNLPHHAQEIYLEAFNSAFNQYRSAEKRKNNRTTEETAHAVAWSAVKKMYTKRSEGYWVSKDSD